MPATVEANQRYVDLLWKKSPPSNVVSTIPTIAFGQEASFGQFPFMASLQMAIWDPTLNITALILSDNSTVPLSFQYVVRKIACVQSISIMQ